MIGASQKTDVAELLLKLNKGVFSIVGVNASNIQHNSMLYMYMYLYLRARVYSSNMQNMPVMPMLKTDRFVFKSS